MKLVRSTRRRASFDASFLRNSIEVYEDDDDSKDDKFFMRKRIKPYFSDTTKLSSCDSDLNIESEKTTKSNCRRRTSWTYGNKTEFKHVAIDLEKKRGVFDMIKNAKVNTMSLFERLTKGSKKVEKAASITRPSKRSIRFEEVLEIREYSYVIGDNPSVSSGVPISLGDLISKNTANMEEYEKLKTARSEKRLNPKLLIRFGNNPTPRITSMGRIRLLRDEGFSPEEMEEALTEVNREKGRRLKTSEAQRKKGGDDRVCERIENVRRQMKNAISFLRRRKSVERQSKELIEISENVKKEGIRKKSSLRTSKEEEYPQLSNINAEEDNDDDSLDKDAEYLLDFDCDTSYSQKATAKRRRRSSVKEMIQDLEILEAEGFLD